MGSRPITFLWLWPATDYDPHGRHVPVNKIWRRTESTTRSGWWCGHMAGIYNDCSARVIIVTGVWGMLSPTAGWRSVGRWLQRSRRLASHTSRVIRRSRSGQSRQGVCHVTSAEWTRKRADPHCSSPALNLNRYCNPSPFDLSVGACYRELYLYQRVLLLPAATHHCTTKTEHFGFWLPDFPYKCLPTIGISTSQNAPKKPQCSL